MVTLLHPANTPAPSFCHCCPGNDDSIVIDTSRLQPKNMKFPIDDNELGIVIVVTLLQYWNTESPRVITLVGIDIAVRLVHPKKA